MLATLLFWTQRYSESCSVDEYPCTSHLGKLAENENSAREKHQMLNNSIQGLEQTLVKKIDDKIDQLIARQDR